MHVGSVPYNPAQHLHELLHAFFGNKPDASTGKAAGRWQEALALSEDDGHEVLLEAYGRVVGLPRRVRNLVEQMGSEELTDDYNDALAKVEKAFTSCGLHSQVKQYYSHIGSVGMNNLKHAAAAVDRMIGPEPELDRDRIAELRKQVDDLFDAVARDDTLDVVVRAFVLRHLDAIARGLRLYVVEGAAPLVDAMDQFFGHVVRERETAQRTANTPIGDRLGRLLVAVSAALRIVIDIPEVVETHYPALEAPTVVIDEAGSVSGDDGSMEDPAPDSP